MIERSGRLYIIMVPSDIPRMRIFDSSFILMHWYVEEEEEENLSIVENE